jgi:acetyl-CoA carboxylase carboxyltransferase component
MNENQQSEIERIAKRFNVPEEFVEAGLKARHASTMLEKWEAFQKEKNLIERGDPEAVRRQHEQGKLTARERIAKLLDQGSFEELELLNRPYETGFDIGEERARGDGVSVGYGTVKGRPVTLWAQDATVLGGTMAAIHARKVTMIAEKAIQAQTPIVGIFDSEGVRVQDAIQFPDFFSSCSIARFQTIASGVIPSVSLIMGPCVGEQAILAGLSDFLFMVKKSSYLHLAPSFPSPDSQKIGDPEVQAKVTGVCDVLAENDEDCLQKCLQLLSFLPSNNTAGPPYLNTGDDPNRRSEELLELVPVKSSKPYSMYKLISLIVDNGEFFEIKRQWAKNLITGFSRFDGYTVGIIANNPQDKAGCMTLDAADKMSRFVRFCDAFNIPLLWLADTPAFYPAIEEETRGLIRHGARMIQANSEASVPQICIAIRKIYGGGRLAMPGPSLGGDLNIAWPTHEPGLMGAEGGVAIIYRGELAAIQDEALRKKQKDQRVFELQWGLDMMVREATEKIIDPRDTRPFLIRALRWLRNKKQDWPARKHENFRM